MIAFVTRTIFCLNFVYIEVNGLCFYVSDKILIEQG